MNDMAPLILVVEDEPDILDVLEYNLATAGFRVTRAEDGETGLVKVRTDHPSLIILDLMLPGIDGFEVCRRLKNGESTRAIPVLMLTARAEEVDRVVGLELGADDYVVKPFSPRELVLRVKAILRRSRMSPGTTPCDHGAPRRDIEVAEVVEVGPLRVDPAEHRATLRGEVLPLTPIEFKLLLTLVQRRGRVQSRQELLRAVWDYEYGGYARTVDTHVRRLREKLGTDSALVETVRGVGYRFRRDSD